MSRLGFLVRKQDSTERSGALFARALDVRALTVLDSCPAPPHFPLVRRLSKGVFFASAVHFLFHSEN